MSVDLPDLLTPAQAAEKLGVGVKHLLALVSEGAIRYIDVGRGKVKIRRKFDPADLAAYIERQRKVVLQVPDARHRRRERKVIAPCPSRRDPALPSGTCDSSSKVVVFLDRLERAAAARPRK